MHLTMMMKAKNKKYLAFCMISFGKSNLFQEYYHDICHFIAVLVQSENYLLYRDVPFEELPPRLQFDDEPPNQMDSRIVQMYYRSDDSS